MRKNPFNFVHYCIYNLDEANSFSAVCSGFTEPESYQDAVNCDQTADWKIAMSEEYNSLIENNTWTLTDLPENAKLLTNRWVFKIKLKPDFEIDRFKARLVVRGCSQRKPY